MKRRVFALVLALCLTLSLAGGAGAAEEKQARVVFERTAPDADGCYSVTMTLYDTTFRVFQFALRYDPAAVTPVDDTGAAAQTFGDFAHKDPDWITPVGTELNTQTGLIDFSGFIMPGTTGPMLDELGQAVVGSDGLQVYTFRFRQTGTGEDGLQIATQEKGEPYRPACPQGVILAGEAGEIPVTVTFRTAQSVDDGDSQDFTGSGDTGGKTAEGLVNQTIFLEIGTHRAVVEGGVSAIYPGEPDVTAYAHDNRTFVPVRFVAERLGADVSWEGDTQTVVVEKDGHTIRMQVGSLTYTLDGQTKQLDVPAEYKASTGGNSRTMVPVRFVTEALGYQVEWEAGRNLVVIAPPQAHWDPAGAAEQQAMDRVRELLNRYGGFV